MQLPSYSQGCFWYCPIVLMENKPLVVFQQRPFLGALFYPSKIKQRSVICSCFELSFTWPVMNQLLSPKHVQPFFVWVNFGHRVQFLRCCYLSLKVVSFHSSKQVTISLTFGCSNVRFENHPETIFGFPVQQLICVVPSQFRKHNCRLHDNIL